MKIPTTILFTSLLFVLSCKDKKPSEISMNEESRISINKHLKSLLEVEKSMEEEFYASEGKFPLEMREQKRDSVYNTNCNKIKIYFEKYGFLGNNLIGEEGTHNFSVLVIHCFNDTDFQKEVIQEMRQAVNQKNAKVDDYAILVDKQKIHSGIKQLYGTQVIYLPPEMWVVPEPVEDSLNLNNRRLSIGLDSIETYLNTIMEWHFSVNQSYYKTNGINTPHRY